MIRKFALLATPILLIGLLEAAFRMGAWEYLAEPLSHAGTSIRMKRILLSPTVGRIDLVTLGSSRPQFGIDHELLAETARQHNMVHADLTMPGVHWMSIGILSQWLRQNHPEVRGGIIALSIQDLSWPGNGVYELGIVQPFRDSADTEWIESHIPIDASNTTTFGSRMALFAWRDDARDFILHPFSRFNRARKYWSKLDPDQLFNNFELPIEDMCKWGVDSLADCENLLREPDASETLKQQCSQIQMETGNRPRFLNLMNTEPLPLYMQETRDLVQAQLRNLGWSTPPTVILMPLPPIWRSGAEGGGLHTWALEILEPLADAGTIHLIDATDFFNGDVGNGCTYFNDFYHQNAAGRAKLSAWLQPKINRFLYSMPD